MKIEKVIVLLLICLPFLGAAQDLLVTTDKDSLDCEILLVDPQGNISFKMDNDRYGGYLSKDFVFSYERGYFRKERANRNVHKALFYMEAEGVMGKYSLDALTDLKIDDEAFTEELEMTYGGGFSMNFFINRNVRNPQFNFLFGFQADYYRFSAGPQEIDYFISIYDQDNVIDEPIPTANPEPVQLIGTAFEIGPSFTVATNNRFSTSLTYSLKVNTYKMDGRFDILQYLSKFTTLNNEFSLSQTILPIKNIAAVTLSAKYATGSYQTLSRAIGVRFNDVSTKATLNDRFRFNNLFLGAGLRFFIR